MRQLLGEGVTELSAARASVRVDHLDSGKNFRDYFKRAYGPTIAAYRALAEDPERTTALDAEMAELAAGHLADAAMEWEYLLILDRRSEPKG